MLICYFAQSKHTCNAVFVIQTNTTDLNIRFNQPIGKSPSNPNSKNRWYLCDTIRFDCRRIPTETSLNSLFELPFQLKYNFRISVNGANTNQNKIIGIASFFSLPFSLFSKIIRKILTYIHTSLFYSVLLSVRYIASHMMRGILYQRAVAAVRYLIEKYYAIPKQLVSKAYEKPKRNGL